MPGAQGAIPAHPVSQELLIPHSDLSGVSGNNFSSEYEAFPGTQRALGSLTLVQMQSAAGCFPVTSEMLSQRGNRIVPGQSKMQWEGLFQSRLNTQMGYLACLLELA